MKPRAFVGFSIFRKTGKALNIGRCSILLSMCKNLGYHKKGGENHGTCKGRSTLIYVGTNNAEREGITAVVKKYLFRQINQTRAQQCHGLKGCSMKMLQQYLRLNC